MSVLWASRRRNWAGKVHSGVGVSSRSSVGSECFLAIAGEGHSLRFAMALYRSVWDVPKCIGAWSGVESQARESGIGKLSHTYIHTCILDNDVLICGVGGKSSGLKI